MPINNIINIKTNNSEIFIGNNVFKVLTEYLRPYKNSKIFILVDENTLEHCAQELILQNEGLHNAEILEIESGELNKTLDVCYQLWSAMAEYKADRNALLINLGGGVITDMGGFVASTFKRGIDFINIPTTLLSQIDASVGGKTGVDFDGLKNIIGLFNEAKGIFIYPPFLKSLDKRQLLSGYAEALKHGLIKDEIYWRKLCEGLLFDSENWEDLIISSITIKNNIVLNDLLEKGERKILNFGHTIGHAVESYSLENDKTPLLHGEAIAIGMICESYISNKIKQLSEENLRKIQTTISSFYPDYQIEESHFHQLIELMNNDKKNEANKIVFSLISDIGNAHFNCVVGIELILESLNYYNTIAKN